MEPAKLSHYILKKKNATYKFIVINILILDLHGKILLSYM